MLYCFSFLPNSSVVKMIPPTCWQKLLYHVSCLSYIFMISQWRIKWITCYHSREIQMLFGSLFLYFLYFYKGYIFILYIDMCVRACLRDLTAQNGTRVSFFGDIQKPPNIVLGNLLSVSLLEQKDWSR